MAKKYDKYELEIIISLGFLILFLISINFISGYSFHSAARGYENQFENSVNISAAMIQEKLENEYYKWGRSPIVLADILQDLYLITDIENITVTDKSGAEIFSLKSDSSQDSDRDEYNVKRPIRGNDGIILAYVEITKTDDLGYEFVRLSRWDNIFRFAGLACAMIAAAYFLWAVLYPYRRIKKEALNYNLDIICDGKSHGIEYVVNTFKSVIRELEEKSCHLEIMYEGSEKKADSIARYNDYILGSITSGVVICDSTGIVTRFNRSAENILNFFERDCRGKHYCDIFGPDHRLSCLLDDALINGKIHSRHEFEIKRPDGERLWLGCSSSMVSDEKGEGMGAVLLMVDLTEIRRLQEISSYSEKMASLGEMAAGLAHEIRNSFAAVVGFANLIKKSVSTDDATARIADTLRNEATAAENLLSRFLNFARPLYLQPEMIKVEELIKFDLYIITPSFSENINIIYRLSDIIPPIYADPALVRQALSNLLINACDAMPEGGDIIVEARLEKKRIEGRHDELLISIIDTGEGIDPEIKGKLFNPFFTTKAGGTGLGLALVKKIVIMHQGRIEFQSKPGKGTRFTVRLPYIDPGELLDKYQKMKDPSCLLSGNRV
ncbi:MAG: PAS domain-containing protein [Candidatus Zixiibacteriota bacterium]|nr:MAG: PAS domain-containing protein [candidate division Zixibacteria bacterium]